ncbi:anhydro-N-acetylmuramic acid kinase [bacterium]|nr:anhydro-N-acetylmuramic acid kinase [bacterium]
MSLNSSNEKIRYVAGCMTGTSIDGIDAALIEIRGHGVDMKVNVINCLSNPLGKLCEPLRRIAGQRAFTAEQIAMASRNFGLLHLDILRKLIGDHHIDLVSVHGQTVYHKPPLSWQLINPSPIAYGLDVPVVHDLRAADLACGGEGAPITPLADYVMFRNDKEIRCIVNLGGFCNVTILTCPTSQGENQRGEYGISGKDICVCNQLLDRISVNLFHKRFDSSGFQAKNGTVQSESYEALLELLTAQSDAKRSLGTGDEMEKWIQRHSGRHIGADIARTACAAIAETIATYCKTADRIILSGGGVMNKTLLREIRKRFEIPVGLSDDYGIPSQFREAIAMAILGALCQDRAPITLPDVTGVKEAPVSGCWVVP